MYLLRSRTFLQKHVYTIFVLLAVWVGIGRSFFGAGGWGVLITLLVWAPVLLVYGFVIGLIAHIRFRRHAYVFSRLTIIVVIVAAALLFLLGMTFVDGGDTDRSIGSAFTRLLGLHSPQDSASLLWQASTVVGQTSYYGSLLALPVLLILVLAEPGGQAATPLKQGQ